MRILLDLQDWDDLTGIPGFGEEIDDTIDPWEDEEDNQIRNESIYKALIKYNIGVKEYNDMIDKWFK